MYDRIPTVLSDIHPAEAKTAVRQIKIRVDFFMTLLYTVRGWSEVFRPRPLEDYRLCFRFGDLLAVFFLPCLRCLIEIIKATVAIRFDQTCKAVATQSFSSKLFTSFRQLYYNILVQVCQAFFENFLENFLEKICPLRMIRSGRFIMLF